jgi:hypothetical protein
MATDNFDATVLIADGGLVRLSTAMFLARHGVAAAARCLGLAAGGAFPSSRAQRVAFLHTCPEPQQALTPFGALFLFGERVMIGPMPKAGPRLNWSRPLPRPLVIPDVMKLATLADVRALIEKHLPKDRRERRSWRHVTGELE